MVAESEQMLLRGKATLRRTDARDALEQRVVEVASALADAQDALAEHSTTKDSLSNGRRTQRSTCPRPNGPAALLRTCGNCRDPGRRRSVSESASPPVRRYVMGAARARAIAAAFRCGEGRIRTCVGLHPTEANSGPR